MSTNLILEHDTDPVVWRGPVIGNMVKQFWSEVYWGEVDYMFVDLPPGTGDVMLTVFQSLPIDGVVIVTSPQSLVSMIVSKAVNMARMIVEKAVRMANLMNVKVAGIVENMSYLECPDCGKRIAVFGESKVAETAEKYGLDAYAQIPVNPEIAKLCDAGKIEELDKNWLENIVKKLEA